jgi:hypothetical protein
MKYSILLFLLFCYISSFPQEYVIPEKKLVYKLKNNYPHKIQLEPLEKECADSVKLLLSHEIAALHDVDLLNKLEVKIYIIKHIIDLEKDWKSYRARWDTVGGTYSKKQRALFITYKPGDDIHYVKNILHHELSSLLLYVLYDQKKPLSPVTYEVNNMWRMFNDYYSYDLDKDTLEEFDDPKMFLTYDYYCKTADENDYNRISEFLFIAGYHNPTTIHYDYNPEYPDSLWITTTEFIDSARNYHYPICSKYDQVRKVWKSFSSFYSDDHFNKIQSEGIWIDPWYREEDEDKIK